jgi:cell division septation protein DedD
MLRAWLLLAAPGLALVVAPALRAAEAQVDAIHLDYRAPAFCPSVDEFVAQVRRAVPRFRLASLEEPAPRFTVTLDGGATGSLTIARDGAAVGSRDVQGASCEEVANVLAFAVALAVDPGATRPVPLLLPALPAATATEPAPAKLPTGSRAQATPAESTPAEPTPPESTPAEPTPPEPTPARATRTRAGQQPPATERGESRPAITDTWWALSAHALAAGGLAPNPTLGGGPSADLGGRIGRLRPVIRVGLEYSTSAPVIAGGARVTFANAMVSLEGCPTAFDLGGLTLLPCARVDTGTRFAAGENIPNGHRETRPWFDVGAMAHLRIHLVRGAFVDLGVGVLYAAIEDRVFLQGSPEVPEVNVHTVPTFGGRGEVALGLEFR